MSDQATNIKTCTWGSIERHKGIYLQAGNMYRGVYKMFKLNGNWTEEVIDDQEAHPFCDTDNQFLKI